MNVLVVDDNVKITDMLGKFLKLKGFDVTIANDGKEGLTLLENSSFNFCILDIAMPNFCGFDVVEQLSEDKKNITKIIVLTAVPLSKSEIEILNKNGVKEILSKPTNLQTLLKVL